MSLDSMKEIFDLMAEKNKPFWEVVLEDDMETRQVTRNQSMAKMLLTWQAMADAAQYAAQDHVDGDGVVHCAAVDTGLVEPFEAGLNQAVAHQLALKQRAMLDGVVALEDAGEQIERLIRLAVGQVPQVAEVDSPQLRAVLVHPVKLAKDGSVAAQHEDAIHRLALPALRLLRLAQRVRRLGGQKRLLTGVLKRGKQTAGELHRLAAAGIGGDKVLHGALSFAPCARFLKKIIPSRGSFVNEAKRLHAFEI